MGGKLVARNAPDGGAVFELVLPRARGTRQAAE
jgi:signal transduction histidine kinase